MRALVPSSAIAAAALAFVLFAHQTIAQAPANGGSTATGSGSSVCGWANPCSTTAKPCCSEYLYCGTGPACLSGCNPLFSVNGYCAPVPVCQSKNYTFTDASRIQQNVTAWQGNATAFDFTLDHQDNNSTSIIQDQGLALILTEAGGGTKVSTTRNILYGNISASIKTVGAAGVVTAFITMSGTKDEIDWEWTTGNMSDAQNNYFWEGDVGNYSQGGAARVTARDQNFIVYGIVWTPDVLEWTVNGKVARTLARANTLVDGLYKFPQTPSKIQFSVWPAGISTSSPGTITWAGGLIDWTKATAQGFVAYVGWLNVQCYDPSQLAFQASNSSSNSSKSSRERSFDLDERAASLWERAQTFNSYVYGTNNSAGQTSVFASDAATVINSVSSTGKNMIIAGKNGGSSGSGSNTAVGNWWAKQSTAAHVGIIIGGCAVALFLLVALCTCVARRKDKKQYATIANAARPANRDNIPLVEKKTASSQYSPPENYQQASRPYAPQQSSYGFQQPAYGSQANLAQGGRPQWPTESGTYSQQQAYGGGAYAQQQQQQYQGYGGAQQGYQQGYQPQQYGGYR